jgi:hypothetical protein
MRLLKSLPLLLAASLFSVPSLAGERRGEIETDYPDNGVRIGNGWSRLQDSKASGQCIEFRVEEDKDQTSTSYVLRIHEKDQLSRNLNVSVRARAQGIAGKGAVSGRASIIRDLALTSENLNLSVRARVDNGVQFAVPTEALGEIVLKERFAELARTDLPRFLRTCGDSYVASIYSGGTVDAVLSFTASTREEKETIERHVKANIGNVSASASMTSFLRTYRESQRLSITMVAFGGSGQPLGVDEATLLSAVQTLPAAVAVPGAAKKFRIGLGSYDQLSNWPRESLSGPRSDRLDTLVSQYLRFQSVYEDMAEILRQPSLYAFSGDVSVDSVRALQDSVQAFLRDLRQEIELCVARVECPSDDGGDVEKDRLAAEISRAGVELQRSADTSVASFDPTTRTPVVDSVPRFSLSSTDYEVRERLPALRRGIAELTEREAIEVRLVEIQQELTRTPKCIKDIVLPPYARLVDEQFQLLDRRDVIDRVLPFRAGGSAYETWIYGVADQRCSDDAVSPLCLSQQNRSALRERMLSRFAEPTRLIGRLRARPSCP